MKKSSTDSFSFSPVVFIYLCLVSICSKQDSVISFFSILFFSSFLYWGGHITYLNKYVPSAITLILYFTFLVFFLFLSATFFSSHSPSFLPLPVPLYIFLINSRHLFSMVRYRLVWIHGEYFSSRVQSKFLHVILLQFNNYGTN